MPTYRYEAHDKYARPAQGTVNAPSEEEAARMIREDRNLFATRIELDGPEPMKTLFEHGPRMVEEPTARPYEPDPSQVKAMYANQAPAIAAAPAAPQPRDPGPSCYAEAVARGIPSDAGVSWRDDLGADLEGLSSALREIDLWKQASLKKGYKGPKVGKKTWAMIDKALPKVVEAVLTDAIQAAAHRIKQ